VRRAQWSRPTLTTPRCKSRRHFEVSGSALGHLKDLIDPDVVERLDRAAGPFDLDPLHDRRLAEPEVDARVPLAQEARGATAFLNVGLPLRRQLDE